VVDTARKVAEIWGTTLDEVARATADNARRLFGLPG
jgi:Tat protein secretion system quality control protein TatD with DNase activity